MSRQSENGYRLAYTIRNPYITKAARANVDGAAGVVPATVPGGRSEFVVMTVALSVLLRPAVRVRRNPIRYQRQGGQPAHHVGDCLVAGLCPCARAAFSVRRRCRRLPVERLLRNQ